MLPSIAIPHNGHGFGRGGASLILDIIQIALTQNCRSRHARDPGLARSPLDSAYRQVHETSAAAVPRLLAVGSPYRLARNCVLKLIQVKEGMARFRAHRLRTQWKKTDDSLSGSSGVQSRRDLVRGTSCFTLSVSVALENRFSRRSGRSGRRLYSYVGGITVSHFHAHFLFQLLRRTLRAS